MKLLGFVERVADPVTQTVAPHQGSSQKPPEQLRELLVKLPGVTMGTRFGGEAFFFRKRFFCHFHRTRDHLFLETFVWNNVDEVMSDVPGTIPHPEYGGYGWVRLPIDSEDAVSRARQLIETPTDIYERQEECPSPEKNSGQKHLVSSEQSCRKLRSRLRSRKRETR